MNPVAVNPEVIARQILLIRGHKVMLDAELAELYGVSTKALNQAVKRNIQRFPEDFMFRLDAAEVADLNRSQSVTGSQKHRDPRFPPFAFTEHGALMIGNVLRSDRAVEISLMIVRAFVQLREMLSTHKELAAKLEALERKVGSYDQAIAGLIDAIRQLMAPSEPKKRSIGFITEK
ncbi:MAG: ORF6N domain-containing protein [Azonexus sp.]|jgi:phage regulator Rha-like protein|nr:ORF6N domain-containing protein [Azonexus sp.]